MDYDDSPRRLNLLSGLVFGAALGAGLALLFLPDERLVRGRRVVVRAARDLSRGARWTLDTAADGARSLRARAAERAGAERDEDEAEDDGDRPALTARARAKTALARRRFQL